MTMNNVGPGSKYPKDAPKADTGKPVATSFRREDVGSQHPTDSQEKKTVSSNSEAKATLERYSRILTWLAVEWKGSLKEKIPEGIDIKISPKITEEELLDAIEKVERTPLVHSWLDTIEVFTRYLQLDNSPESDPVSASFYVFSQKLQDAITRAKDEIHLKQSAKSEKEEALAVLERHVEHLNDLREYDQISRGGCSGDDYALADRIKDYDLSNNDVETAIIRSDKSNRTVLYLLVQLAKEKNPIGDAAKSALEGTLKESDRVLKGLVDALVQGANNPENLKKIFSLNEDLLICCLNGADSYNPYVQAMSSEIVAIAEKNGLVSDTSDLEQVKIIVGLARHFLAEGENKKVEAILEDLLNKVEIPISSSYPSNSEEVIAAIKTADKSDPYIRDLLSMIVDLGRQGLNPTIVDAAKKALDEKQ